MARAWDGLGKEEPNHIHGGHYFYTLCTISRFCGHHADRETIHLFYQSTHSVIQKGELGYENKVKSTYSCFTDHINPIL